MPIMDGYEAAKNIRAHEEATGSKKAVILALTGLTSKEDELKSISCGMDGFHTKPLSLKSLGALLNEYFPEAMN